MHLLISLTFVLNIYHHTYLDGTSIRPVASFRLFVETSGCGSCAPHRNRFARYSSGSLRFHFVMCFLNPFSGLHRFIVPALGQIVPRLYVTGRP